MLVVSKSLLITLSVLLLPTKRFGSVDGHKVTATLITNHNYPVEEHTVHTPDGYILTIYRIPTSFKSQQLNGTIEKKVVFLQHGILCASDDWIINGPETSLAYMFADAGFDVWLGNARGNTYSRQHKHIHPDTSDFWRFSWHEIGVYDLAAMLDYALAESKSSSLHFVAHSQGTTTFFVLMSSLPWYNEKTLLTDVCVTHPAGASTSQIIHYLQLYTSGDFRQYDHGREQNEILYQQAIPPSYNVRNIKTCVEMYYSENDYMSAVEDVEYLASLLPCVELYRIPYSDWNHYDFLWSINVKEVINNRILDKILVYDRDHGNSLSL
ncbi:lipase 3 isoform X3 [Drosophila bipectinata]|uniref:lipase 3 isoform X3 n=1 Tax=Drosophila bipectinata TaxID=42026 RepID=UPI001C8AB772|nr:lipase 3 isoform X4 [Drosophila bipectinata]